MLKNIILEKIAQAPGLSVEAVSISMTVSMAIVSTMSVSQTMVSQMMSVSQTVSVSKTVSVSVVSIGLRLSLSLPLVQPSDVLGRVSAGMELADSISGSEVSQTVDVVKTKTNSVSVSVSVERVSLSAPLSDVVSEDSMKTLGRPGYKRSSVSSMVSNAVSVSVEGSSVSVSVVRISLGTPLTNVVSTASVAGGLDSITKGSRPGRRDTTRAYKGIAMDKGGVSLRGGQGGNSQAGGNQELVHDDTTHWSTEL